MKKAIIFVAVLFVIMFTACSTEPKTIEVTRIVRVEHVPALLPVAEVTRLVETVRVVEVPVEVTRMVWVEVPVEVTRIIEVEVPVEVTREITLVAEVTRVVTKTEITRTTVSTYPTDGLVAAYLFNGNTDDSSGNGYHIDSGGSPVLIADRFGNPNNAYSFDGNNDYFYASTLPAVGQDDGLVTWSAWFKTSDPNDSPLGPIFDVVGAGGVAVRDKIVKGHMELGYDDRPSISTSAFYNDDKWHNVVFSYNGLTLKLYVDGILIGSVDDGDPIDYDGASGNGFSIGRNLWQPYFFKGEIDDILIYNRELSEQEVLDLSTWR